VSTSGRAFGLFYLIIFKALFKATMSMKTFENFLKAIFLLFIFGCSNGNNNTAGQNKPTDSLNCTSPTDTSFLADKNFAYRNLTSTVNVNSADKISKVNGVDIAVKYTDTTFKRKYFMLPGCQAGFLIAPFLPKDYGVNYVANDMWVWLVSKQKKIGDLQPIIVLEIGKADFEGLALIILDRNRKPVNEFFLDEENPTNNKIGYPHTLNNYSFINKNEITSYRITENTDSAKRQKTIDSNVFKSFIAANGTITTKQVGKSHVTKSF
jgi:hypothetical protein